MLFFNDINNYHPTHDTLLIDVREPEEFNSGHIPGARNIPLSAITTAELPADLFSSICLYCLSGIRSSRAVRQLKKMGYTNVRSIGGIKKWKGEIERGSR